MYQTKFTQHEVLQARKEVQQNYARALQMYAPPPTSEEIADALKMLRDARVELAYAEFRQIAANNQKKSPSCGCTGSNKASTGYQTKSLSAGSNKPNHFAKHMERICREDMDRRYEAFCAKFL